MRNGEIKFEADTHALGAYAELTGAIRFEICGTKNGNGFFCQELLSGSQMELRGNLRTDCLV